MAEEVKQAETPVVEKQTNCLGCGKPLKKIRSYYRDGKFYCIKRCWRTYLEKSKAEAGEKK
jgi:hypothetical protein